MAIVHATKSATKEQPTTTCLQLHASNHSVIYNCKHSRKSDYFWKVWDTFPKCTQGWLPAYGEDIISNWSINVKILFFLLILLEDKYKVWSQWDLSTNHKTEVGTLRGWKSFLSGYVVVSKGESYRKEVMVVQDHVGSDLIHVWVDWSLRKVMDKVTHTQRGEGLRTLRRL